MCVCVYVCVRACVCVCETLYVVLQLVQTCLVDAHVFLSLELDGNLDTYNERRRTVVQVSTPLL